MVQESERTVQLTDQQSLRIAELPHDYRVVGVDGVIPMVRKPSGQILRIEQNGRLTRATIAAKRMLADRDAREKDDSDGLVCAVTPYTSAMD
jgi:hypothetical protein